MASGKSDACNNKLNEVSVQNSESDGSTSKVWTPKEGRSWFCQRFKWKMTIGMPEFCKEFGFTCEQDAHDAFSELLSDSQLPLSRRTEAQTAYETWKRDEGERFWACQVTNYRVDVLTTETEGEDRSQFFANKRLRSRDDPNGSSSVSRECRLSSGVPLETNAGAITGSSTTVPVPKRTASGAALETAEEERPKKVLFVEAELSSASGSDHVRSSPSSACSSLNSIDFKLIDHLVGPGTTSSRLRTSNRLTISDVDVSLTIMEKRRTLLKQQSEINDVSDLLTLNFIFDEAWIKRNLSAEAARHLLSVSLPEVPNEERLLLLECSEFAASHTFQETNDFVLKKIGGKGKTITGEVLRGFTERASPWLRSNSYPTPLSTLPQNEDTYTYATMENIVHGTLHDFEVLDHWGRDFLPVPVGWEERYEPDYYAEYFGFPFVLVEIKKPAASDEELEGDSRKLPCMGKLMVDRMGRAGVQDPKVIVFLVQESRCEISVISLDYEATYVKKPVGAFELPRTNLQLPLLIPGQRLLHFVRRTAESTMASIKNRSSRPSILRWIRPSYYVKGNRIPFPKEVNDNQS
ncbi:hypothetical protein B0O80DRAFT_219864 [Mortierella sp. GBAus27b]|nr:hypothetical protein B0O80DRAFT_219864 [Mortierella sp. GBAus27b]